MPGNDEKKKRFTIDDELTKSLEIPVKGRKPRTPKQEELHPGDPLLRALAIPTPWRPKREETAPVKESTPVEESFGIPREEFSVDPRKTESAQNISGALKKLLRELEPGFLSRAYAEGWSDKKERIYKALGDNPTSEPFEDVALRRVSGLDAVPPSGTLPKAIDPSDYLQRFEEFATKEGGLQPKTITSSPSFSELVKLTRERRGLLGEKSASTDPLQKLTDVKNEAAIRNIQSSIPAIQKQAAETPSSLEQSALQEKLKALGGDIESKIAPMSKNPIAQEIPPAQNPPSLQPGEPESPKMPLTEGGRSKRFGELISREPDLQDLVERLSIRAQTPDRSGEILPMLLTAISGLSGKAELPFQLYKMFSGKDDRQAAEDRLLKVLAARRAGPVGSSPALEARRQQGVLENTDEFRQISNKQALLRDKYRAMANFPGSDQREIQKLADAINSLEEEKGKLRRKYGQSAEDFFRASGAEIQ